MVSKNLLNRKGLLKKNYLQKYAQSKLEFAGERIKMSSSTAEQLRGMEGRTGTLVFNSNFA